MLFDCRNHWSPWKSMEPRAIRLGDVLPTSWMLSVLVFPPQPFARMKCGTRRV